MQSSPSGLQLRLVAAGYAVVGVASALLIFVRYLNYVRNPQDVAASGGMYAGGDLMLEILILLLILVPTAALVFVIRKSEPAYTTYAKVLLGLSLTAPLSIGLLFIPAVQQWYWGDAIVFRLFAIPFVLVVILCSRILARFAHARRLISWAALVEGLTFIGVIAAFFISLKSR